MLASSSLVRCTLFKPRLSQTLLRMSTTKLGGDRKSYRDPTDTFDVEDLVRPLNPFEQFDAWFKTAKESELIDEANAACLATATHDGIPSARMVLVKEFGPEGFVFYTNKGSRKGSELASNPRACLVFYWDRLRRSIRIEGNVVDVDDATATSYFQSRPIDSQLSALISQQSSVINDRGVLTQALDEARKSQEIDVKKPEDWGGFRIVPNSIEFWQGQTNRLHDRLRFRHESSLKENEKRSEYSIESDLPGWHIERLAP